MTIQSASKSVIRKFHTFTMIKNSENGKRVEKMRDEKVGGGGLVKVNNVSLTAPDEDPFHRGKCGKPC